MEITLEALEELCEQFKAQVEEYRKVEPKVDTSNLVATFDEDEIKAYDKLVSLLDKLDAMVHGNFNSRVSVAIHEKIRKFESDSKARRDYLQQIDDRRTRIELDEDSAERLENLTRMRKKIDAIRMMLDAEGIDISKSEYLKKNDKSGNLVWNLPKLPGDSTSSDDKEVKTRGRTPATKLLILGTVDDEGHTHWYDFDHIGKAFVEVFGTVRSDACPPGLFSAVEKAGHKDYLKNGWTGSVEYAGHKWVAKVREK